MSGIIWGLALLGTIRRLRKVHQGIAGITYILLAAAPIFLIMAQNYGGEMSFRIYLFTLPLIVIFAASLFYSKYTILSVYATARKTSLWMTVAIIATSLVLLGGFFFTRYGNERVDYTTYAEFNGINYLYSIAPPHSFLLEGWYDTPWEFQDNEKYTYDLMSYVPDAVINTNVDELVRYIESRGNSTYLPDFYTRAKSLAVRIFREPYDTLDWLEAALLKSGEFKLIYTNPDAQIFIFLGSTTGGGS